MFGMLDYRANKLFFLLSRPVWLASLALIFSASVPALQPRVSRVD